jgi:hypothetical protein
VSDAQGNLIVLVVIAAGLSVLAALSFGAKSPLTRAGAACVFVAFAALVATYVFAAVTS